MTVIFQSEKRARVYVRRFDHEEAARRFYAGETQAALAAEYGVTAQAVQRAIRMRSESEREHELELNRRWRTGVCESCGGAAMRLVSGKRQHNPDGRTLCRSCRNKLMRKPLRYSADGDWLLQCRSCRAWKPIRTAFPPRTRRLLAAGKRLGGETCRDCSTAERRSYRERHKVPCERCGSPALPPNEKGKRAADRALCLACYHKSRRNAA